MYADPHVIQHKNVALHGAKSERLPATSSSLHNAFVEKFRNEVTFIFRLAGIKAEPHDVFCLKTGICQVLARFERFCRFKIARAGFHVVVVVDIYLNQGPESDAGGSMIRVMNESALRELNVNVRVEVEQFFLQCR